MQLKRKSTKTVNETVFDVLSSHTKYVRNIVGWEDKGLYYDYAMDSLAVVETFMELEKQYSIKISDDEIQECKTPAQIINIINSKVKK